MKIIRNSAKCTACDVEIESTHRHDFKVHYCKVQPTIQKVWLNDSQGRPEKLIPDPKGITTWRFAVDGGKDYIRRCGIGFEDTSQYE